MFTEEELTALIEEAFEAGASQALDDVETMMNEEDMFDESEEDSAYSLEDEMGAYDEAIDIRKRLNNISAPHIAAGGLKGMASRGGANFKKGLASFRKRVLGGGTSVKPKFDEKRKKLIKAKAKVLLKKKSI